MMTDKFKGFAIVIKGTDRLLVIQGALPIYWRKEVAKDRAKEFTDSEVITTDELLKRTHEQT